MYTRFAQTYTRQSQRLICLDIKQTRPFSMFHAHLFSNSIDKWKGEIFCSFQHGLRRSHVFTALQNVRSRHTPLRINFSFLFRLHGQVKGWDIFPRWKNFLLVSYFYFWAKPFSFWAKRCGRNSLWAKLAISPYSSLFVRAGLLSESWRRSRLSLWQPIVSIVKVKVIKTKWKLQWIFWYFSKHQNFP